MAKHHQEKAYMPLSRLGTESEDQPLSRETSRRFREVLDVFRQVSDAKFLTPLREAAASLGMQKPGAAFHRVSVALEGIEATFHRGETRIKGFLAAYESLPRGSCLVHDETETLQYLRLTDIDIRFLVNAAATMRQVAEVLHECSCVCRKDGLSFDDFSQTLSRTLTALAHYNESFVGAESMVLSLFSSMWGPGWSVDQDGVLVQ